MKTCHRCNISKADDNFNPSQKWCRDCNKEYQQEHYRNNKEYYKEKRYQYQLKIKQHVYNYLASHPCVQCGETRVAALQFDHLGNEQKNFNISSARYKSIASVDREIAKCQVLCANCHSCKTAEDFGWYKNIIR